jgi:hypothetical protein
MPIKQSFRPITRVSLLLLASLLLFGIPAQAQGPLSIHLGPKLGPTLNRLPSSADNFETNSLVGFSGGAFFRLGIKKWLVQPEALISLKGADVDAVEPGTPSSAVEAYKRTFWTLDFPLMLGYKVLDLKLINLRLHAGPLTSIKLAETDEYREAYNDNTSNREKAETFIRDQHWGFMAGLGVDVWKITVDLRYEGSFGDLQNDTAESVQSDDSALRNNVFRFSVGYKFL